MITKNYFTKDLLRLIKWLLLLAIFVYSPFKIASTIIYVFLLIQFLRSKVEDDFFWLVLILVIIDYPGNLFYGYDRGFFQIGILQVDFSVLFSVTAFIKVVRNRKIYLKMPRLLAPPYIIYIIVFIFLLFYGLSFFGLASTGNTGFRQYNILGRTLIMLTVFYSTALIFNNTVDLQRFANLLFYIVIFNFIGQLVIIIFGINLNAILGASEVVNSELVFVGDGLTRALFGSFINTIAVLLASYYLFLKNKEFSEKFLSFVLVIIFLSVLMTASRTWIIAFGLFMILVLFLLVFFMKIKVFGKFLLLAFSVLVIFLSTSILSTQFQGVFERFSTIELLLEGDLTAGGTNIRFTDRHDRVMSKFEEQPFFGWGISGISIDYWDGHVGYQSILLVGGFFGLSYFVYFLAYLFFKVIQSALSTSFQIQRVLNILLAAFFFMTLVIHLGTQRYGFLLWGFSPTAAIITAYWLSLIANLFYHTKRINI